MSPSVLINASRLSKVGLSSSLLASCRWSRIPFSLGELMFRGRVRE
jgi:hypothetical protein